MKILADRPIKKASEDDLGRYKFAKHLAAGILHWSSKESLCLAIHGGWGSGKTSVINLCIEEINQEVKDKPRQERPIVMHFRPWLFSGQEELVGAFLAQLRQKLRAAGWSDKAKAAAERLAKYEPLLEVASSVPKVGWIAKLGQRGLRKAGGAEADLEGAKAGVWEALEELEAPVIIVVDDVDRLTAAEIRQLFQVIKAVADFPSTIYLLAFDDQLVEKALERFQSAGTEGRYLEKIVQLDFEIPAPSSRALRSLLLGGLEQIEKTVASNPEEQHRWNQLKFGPLPTLFRNIRDVKRYLNAVNFKLPTIRGEVNSVDLMIIEGFRIFAPDLYKKVRAGKDILPSDSPRARQAEISSNMSREEADAWANQFFEAAPEWCQEQMKEVLGLAFPEVQRIRENIGRWGPGFKKSWMQNRRICMTPYFRYYFQEALPEGEVSEREANNVYASREHPENLNGKIASFFRDGRIGKLLWKLEDRFNEDPDEKAIENLIRAVFEGRELKPQAPDREELPCDWEIEFSVERLLGRLDYEARKRVLKSCIEASKAIVYPVTFVAWRWQVWNPDEGEEDRFKNQEKLFTKEDTDEFKDLALKKLREHAEDGQLHKALRIGVILNYWTKWAGIEEVRAWVASVLEDDQKLPDFLRSCGTFVSSWGAGSHYQRHTFTIDPNNLEPYCDVAQLRGRCEEILGSDPEWLDPNQKAILEAFLRGLRGLRGRNADED
ncbi:P-loop NTPase fold protein [Acidobacteria bacterium AH-259-O06]|nr:P-loop NTPase fold protein [Acidobacteria bacterium AH-259-O06]